MISSTAARNASLDNDYGATRAPGSPTSHDLALFVGNPAIPEAQGGGVELGPDGGYTRVTIPNDASWLQSENGAKAGPAVTFPTSTGAWSAEATHWALYGSDGLWWDTGELSEPVDVTAAGVTLTCQPVILDPSDRDFVAPSAPAVVAAFSALPTSGTVPLAVTFADMSSGTPTSWAWNFGDGATASVQNPTHTYSTGGTYTVTLTASNGAGSDTATATITATTAANPQPDAWNTSTMLGADGLHPNDTGMTYLADAYVWALENAGKTPAAGTTMVAYGDSWTAQDIENTPGQRAIVQLASRLGTSLTNRAVGGYLAGDIASCAIGTNAFTPASAPLVVLANAGLNDLSKTDTAQQRAATEAHLRALFATLSAAERIEQTAFTYSGTWSSTTNPLTVASGGSCAIANSNDDVATYSITTPGTYYLLLFGSDGVAPVCGQITVSQGGTTLATIDGNQKHVNTGKLLTAGYGPLTVRLDGVAAGTLTISYNTLGRASASGFPDALLRMSDTPPTILAVKPVRTLDAARQKPALLDYIRDLYDVMAAEFGTNVVVCDPDPSWTP